MWVKYHKAWKTDSRLSNCKNQCQCQRRTHWYRSSLCLCNQKNLFSSVSTLTSVIWSCQWKIKNKLFKVDNIQTLSLSGDVPSAGKTLMSSKKHHVSTCFSCNLLKSQCFLSHRGKPSQFKAEILLQFNWKQHVCLGCLKPTSFCCPLECGAALMCVLYSCICCYSSVLAYRATVNTNEADSLNRNAKIKWGKKGKRKGESVM